MRQLELGKLTFTGMLLAGCAAQPVRPVVPSLDYSNNLRRQNSPQAEQSRHFSSSTATGNPVALRTVASVPEYDSADIRARLRLASDVMPAMQPEQEQAAAFQEYPSSMPNTREYQGTLPLGNPGVTSSLWRESRSGNDLFRDERAWQPMDLLTIVVSENAEGTKEADTEVKQKSTVEAAIENILGLEGDYSKANKSLDPTSMLKASTQNDFKGEGKTNRKDSLKARISAMVVEVLPSGILRIEGERIIAVNNEEQTMIISGLARPRDINSANEIDSSKLANMRIDYYGSGTVGEAQRGGWLGRLLRTVWPF